MTQNISATDAWAALQADPDAVLVDVRAPVEWATVGVPDLSGLGREAVQLSWQVPPVMTPDPAFLDKLAAAAQPQQAVYFICRSGARSMAAAMLAEAAGYGRTFNVANGFEGQSGAHAPHAGWKQAGLPWRQG